VGDDGVAHGGAPSAELGLHQLVYARDPEAQVVLHAHSTNAVLLSRRVGTEVTLHGFELQKALRGVVTHDAVVRIPVLDNDQDMVALAPRVAAALDHTGSRWAFVLRGHGVYAWGRTVPEALRHLEALDVLFACALAESA
jgi:methylthioribulose-1-phosphate dehydratase